jgi:hypothetical protein
MRYLKMIALVFGVTVPALGSAHAQAGWYTEGDYAPVVRVKVVLSNTLDIPRLNCPIVIPREVFPLVSFYEADVTVVDPALPSQPDPTPEQAKAVGSGVTFHETNGHLIPSQLDDLDRDGLWDELFFMSDFKPGETKTFYVYIGVNERGQFEHHTHAEMGSYGKHITPWWESETMGWKLWYFSDVDLYGKNVPRLVADHENTTNLSGYTAGSEYGNDIMTVSDTFGAGGICLFEDPTRPDHISRARFSPFRGKGQLYDTRYAYDVVVNGPLRSMIRVHVMNWQSGQGVYEYEQLYTAYAGQSYSTCAVNFPTFIPERPGTVFGCAIRKIMNEYKTFQQGGTVISFGKDINIFDPDVQQRYMTKIMVDFEATALVVKDSCNPKYQYVGESSGAHTFRIPVSAGRSFEYLIAAGWSGGKVNTTADEFQRYVTDTARGFNHPVEAKEIVLEKK